MWMRQIVTILRHLMIHEIYMNRTNIDKDIVLSLKNTPGTNSTDITFTQVTLTLLLLNNITCSIDIHFIFRHHLMDLSCGMEQSTNQRHQNQAMYKLEWCLPQCLLPSLYLHIRHPLHSTSSQHSEPVQTGTLLLIFNSLNTLVVELQH